MKTQTVLEQLTDRLIYTLESVMTAEFEDFAEIRKQYERALAALGELPDSTAPISPDAEAAAIRQQIATTLLFCGLLGLKANWDHFADPVARTFLEVEAETYLREATLRRLPEYAAATQRREQFCRQLTAQQQTLYEDINTYTCYWETVGAKLAHYYGYLFGNSLLPQVVPGYHPDQRLTARYSAMLEDYFGQSISASV